MSELLLSGLLLCMRSGCLGLQYTSQFNKDTFRYGGNAVMGKDGSPNVPLIFHSSQIHILWYGGFQSS